jgi:alginate O-acetyltransferase complex protein AlgI
MLFNSFTFLIFLPLVFILYWSFKSHHRIQNIILLLASYLFYAWWDYRFLGLIIASTLVDYGVGLAMGKTESKIKRNYLLYISLVFNLGLLGFFKYFNFFIDSFVDLSTSIGLSANYSTLQIILPVGISFYTFQTLSYTLDIFRKDIMPTKSLLSFGVYVAFFPQLVAGPIERAKTLLPQFLKQRQFNYNEAVSGVKLIILGLFKKVVIADNCAFFVDQIFTDPNAFHSGELWVGAILFSFQIYGDFSGYSDIAIGTARLFNIKLMTNFKYPYFSKNLADFWHRWHISLSTWFRDYVYIPLGGSRGNRLTQIRNVIIVFLVSGFWHGANWTFIIWGAIHALLFLPLIFIGSKYKVIKRNRISIKNLLQIVVTFTIVTLAWVFFRAESVADASHYILGMFEPSFLNIEHITKTAKYKLLLLICLIAILAILMLEFGAFKKNREEVRLNRYKCFALVLGLIYLGAYKNPSEFIYFQF